MVKKVLAVFTIMAFFVFPTACTTWTTRGVQGEGDHPSPGRKVARVVKADGQVVDFTGHKLGRVLFDKVQGPALVYVERTVELKRPLGLIKKRADGSISEVTDAEGRVHYVFSVVKDAPEGLTIVERRTETKVVSIPLSEVRLIKYRKGNSIMTAMALAAGGAVALLVVAFLTFDFD